MATRTWTGNATAVGQVSTATPVAANSAVYTLTINGKTVSYTADASATVAEITAALTTAWNASEDGEFEEVTATDSTTYVTLTADEDGVPFTVIGSTSGGGSLTVATTTTATGPNYFTNANNWAELTVPVSGDDVVFDRGSVGLYYGLTQSAITLTSLTHYQTYTGNVGLPTYNTSGDYAEYRDQYLAIGATTVVYGLGTGTGSARFKLDTGSVQTAITVQNTGSSAENGVPAFLFKGTHASNALRANKGTVGVAVLSGEIATVTDLQVSAATVSLGTAVTLATIVQSGGSLLVQSGTTSLTLTAGELTVLGGNHTALTVRGQGTCKYGGTVTVTTLSVRGGGSVLYTIDLRTRTVTTCYIYKGATLRDPNSRTTFTNGINFRECDVNEVTVELGKHRNLVITTAA